MELLFQIVFINKQERKKFVIFAIITLIQNKLSQKVNINKYIF